MSFCTFVLDLAVGWRQLPEGGGPVSRLGGSREAGRYAIMLSRDKDRVQMSASAAAAPGARPSA